MVARAPSLRYWLVAAMTASAIVGLAAAVLLFNHVLTAHDHAADAAKARLEARTIAAEVQGGADRGRLSARQALLFNDRVTVRRGGEIIFQGPARTGQDLELRVTAPFSGGAVTLADYASKETSTALTLTLITAGVLALVILAAVTAASLVARGVRAPVRRAIDAAERVSHGDFTARMGASGPDELIKLGSAFDDMAARLEQADRDQRQFLADVAHEIATPVNAVSGFALALTDGTADGEASTREAREVIDAQTGRLHDLLTDLRELTQLDVTGRVRMSWLQLRACGEELLASIRPEADAAGVAVHLDADDVAVRTDGRLVTMIATNLLSNAVRYTPSGGTVQVALHHRGGELVLTVRDTGVGIAPEHHRRIFERLYRVDSTRDRATGGSGLGLAIVQRAVRALDGRIEIVSAVGQGSEFRVHVPATARAGD